MPDTSPLRPIAVSRPPVSVASLHLASQRLGPAGIARSLRYLALITGGHPLPARAAWHPGGLDRWFAPSARALARPPLHLTLRRRLAAATRGGSRRTGPVWPSWPAATSSSAATDARFADDTSTAIDIGAASLDGWSMADEIDAIAPALAADAQPHGFSIAAGIPARHELFIGRSVLPDAARTPALPERTELRADRLDLPFRPDSPAFDISSSTVHARLSPFNLAASVQPPTFRLPFQPPRGIVRTLDAVESAPDPARLTNLPLTDYDTGNVFVPTRETMIRQQEPLARTAPSHRGRMGPFALDPAEEASRAAGVAATVASPFPSDAQAGRRGSAPLVLHIARAPRPPEPAPGLASARRFVTTPVPPMSLIAAAEFVSQVMPRYSAPIGASSFVSPFTDRSMTTATGIAMPDDPFVPAAAPGSTPRDVNQPFPERGQSWLRQAAPDFGSPDRPWLGRAAPDIGSLDRPWSSRPSAARGWPDQGPLRRWMSPDSPVWRAPRSVLPTLTAGLDAAAPETVPVVWQRPGTGGTTVVPWLPSSRSIPPVAMPIGIRPETRGTPLGEADRVAGGHRLPTDLASTAFGPDHAVGISNVAFTLGAEPSAIPQGTRAPLRRASWQPDRLAVPPRRAADAALSLSTGLAPYTSPWTGLLLSPPAPASAARSVPPGTPPTLVPPETRRSMQVSPFSAPVAPSPPPSTLSAPARGGPPPASDATPLSPVRTEAAPAATPSQAPMPAFVAEMLARSAWGAETMARAELAPAESPRTATPFAEGVVFAPFSRPMVRNRRLAEPDAAAPFAAGSMSPTWGPFAGWVPRGGAPSWPNASLVPPGRTRNDLPTSAPRVDGGGAASWPVRSSPVVARSPGRSLTTGSEQGTPWVSPAASLVASLLGAPRPIERTLPPVFGKPFGDWHVGSRPSAPITSPGPMVFRSSLPDRVDPTEDHRGEAAEAMATSIGVPLPPIVRRTMERTFGMDLASVRIHSGSQAARATDLVAGRAMARGTDVFLPGGIADSATAPTMPLLAHELTHVAQHLGHRVPEPRSPLTLAQRSASEEQAADRIERRVAEDLTLTLPTRNASPANMTPERSPVAMPMPMPVPMQSVMQREEVEPSPGPGATVTAVSPVTPGPGTATSATPAGPTPDQLAEQVYALLERRLIVERERGGYRR